MRKKKKPLNDSLWDDYNKSDYMRQSRIGLDVSLVRRISEDKGEPNWMLEKRLESLKLYEQMAMPSFGPDLSKLDLANITYYAKAVEGQAESWDDVPADIKNTFDRLGIPKAEQEVLAGVGAQYESTMVYHSLKEEYKKKGVIFEDLDVALKKYPQLVEPYFMKVMPTSLHKFSALHGAVWSGGTFLYIPAGIKLKQPLQAYFRMNAKGMGQFEHTLIIVEKHAEAHYIEGCSAPRYGADSLHAGGVEIYVKEGARFRYSSVESWSKDAYNLNTKRAIVEKNAHMEWVGGNFGSNTTMLYPCSILVGEGASADHLGVAFAGDGQVQDTGAKVIHAAKNTSSTIVMKSISKGGGKSVYRGSIEIKPEADNAAVSVKCDALILDDRSISDTIPAMRIDNSSATVAHEASAGKISTEDLFYLRSRGLKEDEAAAMIVNGFIEPITKELPLEYSVEMNRMVELEMENSVG
ncbi:MAG: Fe-S cluster assembly protein SufB [bacterium]|nr:Fe-S cluster assembly protein SufB [bacterium]